MHSLPRKIIKFWGTTLPKPRCQYESMPYGGAFRINFDHLGFSNVHLSLIIPAFLHVLIIGIRPLQPGSNPRPRDQQRVTTDTTLTISLLVNDSNNMDSRKNSSDSKDAHIKKSGGERESITLRCK